MTSTEEMHVKMVGDNTQDDMGTNMDLCVLLHTVLSKEKKLGIQEAHQYNVTGVWNGSILRVSM